jgi:tRNA-uridine 2-sulfurtransferase
MRIAVAMSGGMDSTAAALLLKRAGHQVMGLHMRLHAGSDRSFAEAEDVAREIGVPLREVDLSRDFSELIVRPFVQEYAAGRTPSPCPRCNRLIKMTLLYEEARRMGCDILATGHYARIETADHGPRLLKGSDRKKDQSYFLFALTRDMLSRTVFPLGDLTKTGVRELLKREGISVWASEESQELCFVPKGDYRAFLEQNGILSRPGTIEDMRGKLLGQHHGITGYTVGQRRGLGACGPEPHYVARIDARNNTVIVGTRDEILTSRLIVTAVNILTTEPPQEGDRLLVKVRSTAKAVPCIVKHHGTDRLVLSFQDPQPGIAPGQAAVLYAGERVVGGGWIEDDRQDS